MLKKRSTKLLCLLIAFIWTTVIVGSSYAYFIDSVQVTGNVVAAGNLKAGLEYKDKNGDWQDASKGVIFDYQRWEPGYTDVKYIKVHNKGNLAFQYELNVFPAELLTGSANLMDVLEVYYGEGVTGVTRENYATELEYVGTLMELLDGTKHPNGAAYGILLPEEGKGSKDVSLPVGVTAPKGSVEACMVLHMRETAGNEYQNLSVGEGFTVQLAATQYMYENDSFGNTYDQDAELPVLNIPTSMVIEVQPVNGLVPYDVWFNDPANGVSATVPAGAKMAPGATRLTLVVEEKKNSEADVTLSKKDKLTAFNVKVEGLADDNTVPVIINMGKAMSEGMNLGNYDLYHVENGVTTSMTLVNSAAELDAHNEFIYNPATGEVIVAMATFSEVAVVADTENPWKGEFDYSWYDASKTDLTIANADQLAAFGAIVGGMDDQTQDTFAGKTVKLVADVNLGDAEESNTDLIFYPIGYYNSTGSYEKKSGETGITSSVSSFEGSFDGNGHTIKNFYQNTWEMFGDYNDGYSGTPNHYKDAMGLFGYVKGGTIKNLTVDHFSSDGEFTPTGVIAAYAVNSTFENIAITNCNPRVYNTGNGGIVGIGGDSSDGSDKKLTFTNITIDNTNKISALWGSWDVACGGIMGMFRGNSTVKFTNCHVAAQIDVFNDVCGNYQYYWYRYAGMMIGSLRGRNTTDAQGYTVPDMTDITADGCTVHFGTWNDYYYCELVANSLASYTHDHQFSRLEQVEKVEGTTITYLDGTTGTVPASGWANYVVVEGEASTANATCHHFKNGEVWNHIDAGYEDSIDEDGDDKVDLKEDKQHVYLPFNQLFQGDGWGVKHIPIYNGEDYAFKGITILDREVADSVEKFEKADTAKESYMTSTSVTVGELFKAATIEEDKPSIKDDKVQVFVSPDGKSSNVSATYTANTTDWTQGTLTFTGTGAATITITDYYYCKVTTIKVEITEKVATEKFETKFVNHETYLYRVGNQNPVKLSSLFEVVEGADIGTVSVTVETIEGSATAQAITNASSSAWASQTLQFSGTGVVKVTIKDDDTYCIPTVLYLEVVDAENLTSATVTTVGGNFVLLCDVNTSNYVNYWNCTLYGNGFTYSLNGAPTAYNSKQGHGILITKNATLDNLVIVGDVYDEYGAYTTNNDYNAAIDATNTIIQNCHISNCSTPVRANGVTITNTTLYGGTVANLIISGGTNTLEDVTTVNYNDGRKVLGLGIVISDGASENVKLVLNGELKQYNFVCADDVSAVPDSNAQKLFNAMFEEAYGAYHFNDNGKTYVNTGILAMVSTFDETDIINNTGNGYNGAIVSYSAGLSTATGFLYSLPAKGNSVDNGYVPENDTNKGKIQGDYLPTFEFDLGDQAISNDGADDTRYLTGNANGVEALYQNNESPITLDLTKLATVYKYTGTSYSVSASYKDANGKVLGTDSTVSLTASGTLVFTVTDDLFYNENGEKLGKSVERTYEVPLTVSVKQATIKNAVLEIEQKNLTGTYTAASIFDNSQYLSFNPLDAITVTDYDVNGTGITVELTANISTTTVDYVNTTSGAWGGATITITYTDGRVLTIVLGSSTMNSPGANNGGKTITVTKGTVKSDGKVAKSSATGGTWPITSYSFKGNNGSTVTKNEEVTVYFADATGCVTPDTLITMADGSKKEIQHVTYEDQLLVWNFFTGTYDVAPSSIIFYHGHELFDVMSLKFDDGTTVKTIHNHGFYDVEENKFVILDEENVASYLGHSFVKVDGEQYKAVKLVDYSVEEEYTGCYSIQTAQHNNFMVEDMFSITKPAYEGWFDYFEIGDNLKYDETKMQADIEKYGLYTYEEFAEYVTYEQFVAFSGPYLKVLVGRGVVTFEDILNLINTYVK